MGAASGLVKWRSVRNGHAVRAPIRMGKIYHVATMISEQGVGQANTLRVHHMIMVEQGFGKDVLMNVPGDDTG